MASRNEPYISHGGASVFESAPAASVKSSADTTAVALAATVKPTATSTSIKPKPKSDVVVHQKLDNWMLMIRQERIAMMKGPKITIYIGTVAISNIPKRAAMAVSKTLNHFFTDNRQSSRFDFEAGLLTQKAVRALLVHWLQETSDIFEAHEVPLQGSFTRDMAVLRAARYLGMEPYTKSMLNYYTNYMRTTVPTPREIGCVEAMRTPWKDPVWTALINRLARLRHTGQIEDPEKFSRLLIKHPDVAYYMDRTDEYLKNRAAEKRQRYQGYVPQKCDSTTGQAEEITPMEAVMMWVRSFEPIPPLF
ncbi:hypothetical protein P171DRAFT_481086 [Karstenula rhodostoma CBS 690.94]|uniref:Uncharacterized protein n=1 Tax=Karstenula rhodostoma CBS 690.94 TaxID=1392251 RepID=A0A9P4UI83_9PLEO|nr:hypothetical protein P171DRAFT_481086 [Karstenula rhodostoma CBS 690.94]